MSLKSNIAVLGSTGSIGTQSLDVVRKNPDDFKVIALAAETNVDLLEHQILEFEPKFARIGNEELAKKLIDRLKISKSTTKILIGENGLSEIVQLDEVETVLVAITGYAAFPSLVKAIENNKNIALANKESLIVGGAYLRQLLKEYPVKLLPVDSEHNSIYQCLEARPKELPARVLITASGGPFLNHTFDQLKDVTPKEAIKHPKWSMGEKISVDSATLMNKGLEVIEALELFSFPVETMEVVVHPQHLIHAMVEYSDGSTFALMYEPDMRVPIAHALYRCACETVSKKFSKVKTEASKLNFTKNRSLDFFPPDENRFPCLRLARESFQIGGDAPMILNWANEVAVHSFLRSEISFMQIPEIIEESLKKSNPEKNLLSLSDIYESQKNAEKLVAEIMDLVIVRAN